MGREMGRAKRYAQWHFVDISAIERFMLRQVGCIFCNCAKTTSNSVNIKQSKNIGNMCQNWIHDNFVNFSESNCLYHVDVISKP